MAKCPECDGMGEWDEGPLPARSSTQIDPEYRRVICQGCNGNQKCESPDCDENAVALNEDGEAQCRECYLEWVIWNFTPNWGRNATNGNK